MSDTVGVEQRQQVDRSAYSSTGLRNPESIPTGADWKSFAWVSEPVDNGPVLGHSYSSWCSFNEVNCKWVAEETWSFKTIFDAKFSSSSIAHLDLALMGIDTAAELLINGQLVAQLSNAFRYSNHNTLLVVGQMLAMTVVS